MNCDFRTPQSPCCTEILYAPAPRGAVFGGKRRLNPNFRDPHPLPEFAVRMGGAEPARPTGPVPAMTEPDRRLFSPSTARNRAPILAVLQGALPADAKVLEIASGSGEHAVFFARAMPRTVWQTSDPDAESRASIAAWIAHEALANVLPPRDLDVRRKEWGAGCGLRCDRRDQYDPYCAVGFDAGAFRGRARSAWRGRNRLSLWAVQARRQTHRAVQRSVRPLAEGARSGCRACAISTR